MALFIDRGGDVGSVQIDLSTLVEGDGNLDFDIYAPDTGVEIVTYTPSTSGAGQDLIHDLADAGDFVVLGGVTSSFLIDGVPISSYAGVTYMDGTIIRILYDVTQCNGANYYVYNTDGDTISFPNAIILGHECFHALHWINGDESSSPEVQAETDENTLRSQHGLPLRDVNNHNGGCGTPSEGETTISCFVASAAYGSPIAPQVNNFRRMRNIFLNRSVFGQKFFDSLYGEYYEFSPEIAGSMHNSDLLKERISLLAVQPLMNFFTILESYLHESRKPGVEGEFDRELEEDISRFADTLHESGIAAGTIGMLYQKLLEVQNRFEANRPPDGCTVARPGHDPSFDPAGDRPERVLDYLADMIESRSQTIPFTLWGIVFPLTIYWGLLARHANRQDGDGSTCSRYFSGMVDEWLGSLPVPSSFAELDEMTVRNDLAQLAEIALTIPGVRQKIAIRLIGDFGSRVPYNLRNVLRETGYLQHDPDSPGGFYGK